MDESIKPQWIICYDENQKSMEWEDDIKQWRRYQTMKTISNNEDDIKQ